MLMYAPL
jgi:hypothetical protein